MKWLRPNTDVDSGEYVNNWFRGKIMFVIIIVIIGTVAAIFKKDPPPKKTYGENITADTIEMSVTYKRQFYGRWCGCSQDGYTSETEFLCDTTKKDFWYLDIIPKDSATIQYKNPEKDEVIRFGSAKWGMTRDTMRFFGDKKAMDLFPEKLVVSPNKNRMHTKGYIKFGTKGTKETVDILVSNYFYRLDSL